MKLPTFGLRRSNRLFVFGVVAIVVVAAVLLVSIYKPQLRTMLLDGEYRTIHVPANHFLLDDVSTVKVAGVDVGLVHTVERSDDGSAKLTVKVSDDVPSAVGTRPTAAVRPNTLLGGKYYIDVRPGGERGQPWTDPIPLERTRLPVELDDVAQALQPDALQGAGAAVRQFDKTLGAGGSEALQELLADAPAALEPGARAIDALRGTRPQADLPRLVSGLNTMSDVLTRREGQLASILKDTRRTTSALADSDTALAAAIDRLPGALDTTNAGLTDLRTTLRKLRDTAGPARPSVRQLSEMLREVDPVLERANPVVNDLRVALADARPLVDELVPVSKLGTEVLDLAGGDVLDRVNGPVKKAVLSPYQGTGPYRHTRGEAPFYQELAYMFSGLNATGAYVDDNGHAVAFQPGGGLGTVSGIGPFSIEEMFQHLLHGEGIR